MSFFDIFTRNEKTGVITITILIFLSLIIATLPLYPIIGDKYDLIEANYNVIGENIHNINISERYIIDPSYHNYNVLYRSFDEEACISEDYGCKIKIKSVECKLGKPYFASNSQPKRIFNPNTKEEYKTLSEKIERKIYNNEVGCFLEESYNGKKEEMKIKYETITSKNIHTFFSKEHFPIKKFVVKGNFNGKKYEKSYSYIPKNLKIKINITNGDLKYNFVNFNTALLIIFLLSSIPYLIWIKFGKDKQVYVPKYLHTIPEKIEPWKVAVLTDNSSLSSLSKNALASLFLELYVKKILTFKEKEKVFVIKKDASIEGVSNMAKKLYNLLLEYKIKEDDNYIIIKLPMYDRKLYSFVGFNPEVISFEKEAYNDIGSNIYTVYMGLLMFFYPSLAVYAKDLFAVISTFIFFPVLFFLLYFSKIFSTYKEDYYKKTLEWIAFKNMLSDLAMIKKYFKEDYSQWKEWLLYGTALGEAKNVLKSMKELKYINPEEYEKINRMNKHILYVATAATSSSSSSGTGGGFGGGGGGGR